MSNEEQPQTSAHSIMIIDDSDSVRELLKHLLAPLNPTIYEAANGREALDLLAKIPTPTFIILDVNMPTMNGIEFAEKYSETVKAGKSPRIPIVMLTTEATRDIALRAQRAGISGWLVKPPRGEILLSVINKLSKKKPPVAA